MSGRALAFVLDDGVAWFAAYTVVLNWAEQHLDAGTAALLVNVAPILVAVVAVIAVVTVIAFTTAFRGR